jgi:predicted dehydrogenase
VQDQGRLRPVPEKASQLIAQKGISAAVHTDYRDLVKDPSIDLVSVCLPPSVPLRGLGGLPGDAVHVLTEKAHGRSLAECDAMIEAAQKGGALLSVVAQTATRSRS